MSQPTRAETTEAQIRALADAAWRVLDDMCEEGQGCCLAHKAMLRRPQAAVSLADLPTQLRADADAMNGWGAGNEAEHARQAADEIERLRKALTSIRKFLENPCWGKGDYMDGSDLYGDRDSALDEIRYAFGELT